MVSSTNVIMGKIKGPKWSLFEKQTIVISLVEILFWFSFFLPLITTVNTPHLDGKHVVFGEVFEEDFSKIKNLEQYGSSPSGETSATIWIKKTDVVEFYPA